MRRKVQCELNVLWDWKTDQLFVAMICGRIAKISQVSAEGSRKSVFPVCSEEMDLTKIRGCQQNEQKCCAKCKVTLLFVCFRGWCSKRERKRKLLTRQQGL